MKLEAGAFVRNLLRQGIAARTTEMASATKDDELIRHHSPADIAAEGQRGVFVFPVREGDLAQQLQRFLTLLIRDDAPAALTPQQRGVPATALSHFVVEHKGGAPLQRLRVHGQVGYFQSGRGIARIRGANLMDVKLQRLAHLLLVAVREELRETTSNCNS